MATLTLTSVTLGSIPVTQQLVNVKIRKTSDPDIASSYTNIGDFYTKTNGDFVTPVLVNSLVDGTSYTVWYSISCSNTSGLQVFEGIGGTFSNVRKTAIFKKNNCTAGQSGTNVEYVVEAGEYTSSISQADADQKAQDDIDDNGQDFANTNGTCLDNSSISTILVDYNIDQDADLCMYCNTVGVAETNQIVASTANGGPLQYPNDGRAPAEAYLLSSDKLPGPPVRRFGINMSYFIAQYPAINVFEFIIRGRTSSATTVAGSYAKRPITEGYLVMNNFGMTTLKIPGVSSGSSGTIGYSTHVAGGANGTVGVGVGSPILKLVYTVSSGALVATTY